MCTKMNSNSSSHERRPFLTKSSTSTNVLAHQMKKDVVESKHRRLPKFLRLVRSIKKNKVWLLFTLLFFGCLKIGYQIGTNLVDANDTSGSTRASRQIKKISRHHHHRETAHEKLRGTRKQSALNQTQVVTSRIVHPYERIWPGHMLPMYMLKDPQYDIESVPTEKKACFVHVGKTAGSTVGCSLGFNLHCTTKVQAPGVLPHYTTNMFHAQMYDCDDETTAFFIFIVRHPLDRWISAFNYDNPSRDWEGFRRVFGEKHFEFRSQLYAECPFHTVNDVGEALSAESNVTDVCKRRAEASIDGTMHFGCHHYYNYQFHLEAIPKNATIMTIRTEHLIEDWNSVEHNLGGGPEVLGKDNNVIAHNNVNNATDDKLKYLTAQSKRLICARLCNEIQTYKMILRLSINLNEKQVQESVDELASSCPVEALATSCNTPMPNITDKLIHSRGYLP